MESGDSITCRLNKGGKIVVTLDDRVYPDRSCGQYEAGWWVFTTLKHPHSTDDYFLNESGILWAFDKDTGKFDRAIGIHVPWYRRVKQADAELEQMVRYELQNQGRKHEV